MVHRAERIVDILYSLRKYKLEPKIIRFVQSRIEKEPNLVLIKSVKNAENHLKIENHFNLTEFIYLTGDGHVRENC